MNHMKTICWLQKCYLLLQFILGCDMLFAILASFELIHHILLLYQFIEIVFFTHMTPWVMMHSMIIHHSDTLLNFLLWSINIRIEVASIRNKVRNTWWVPIVTILLRRFLNRREDIWSLLDLLLRYAHHATLELIDSGLNLFLKHVQHYFQIS